MATSNHGNLDKLHSFLNEQKFGENQTIPDKFKCGKCKKLLTSPCVARCLCRFCRNCIGEMIANGIENCPGNKTSCRRETLSNFVSDHAINKKLLKLVLKCPEEACSFECQLGKMEDHVRLCPKKTVKCLFSELGCNDDKVVANRMSDHLHSESYNHYKIMLDLMDNFRNELATLKLKDERNKHEIDNLKRDVILKNEMIETIKEENRQLKRGKIEMDQRVGILKLNLDNEINKLRMGPTSMTMGSRDQVQVIDQMKIEELLQLNKQTKEFQIWMTKRIDHFDNLFDKQMEGIFMWKIDEISTRKEKYESIRSGCFFSRIDAYKMQLELVTYGGGDILCVQLFIHSGERDADLKWPFQRNVTITISNKSRPGVSKSITNPCNTQLPARKSVAWCSAFKFSLSSLSGAGLLDDNSFIIECDVGM